MILEVLDFGPTAVVKEGSEYMLNGCVKAIETFDSWSVFKSASFMDIL